MSACSSEGKMGSTRKCYLICTSKFSSNRGGMFEVVRWPGITRQPGASHMFGMHAIFSKGFFLLKS